jgi:predicted Zn-dependent protease
VLEKYQMVSLAENVVKTALLKGAVEAEAYVYEGQATNVGVERGQITKTNTIIDRGLGVRAIVNKAVGFAYTNIIEGQKAVEDTILGALSAARASKPDQDWSGFPEKKTYVAADKIYDPRILELRSEGLVDSVFFQLKAVLA